AAINEARQHGAKVRIVGSHIGEAAAALREHMPDGKCRNLSTFGEPGRVEGKKTITLEICEQIPDGDIAALIFPTGGGTGLVAARKALAELEALGRRGLAGRPKLIAAQSTGCAPIVKAWESGADRHQPWPDPTGPAGLRVPNPLAGPLILQAIRETGGAAMAADPEEIAEVQRLAFQIAGIAPCLESAAAFAIIPKLLQRAVIEESDRVVVISTGDAVKDPA
ncbi:MAG: pyridoxal-phosphate dependent enzyme, partial [Planctomycetota bacterium]